MTNKPDNDDRILSWPEVRALVKLSWQTLAARGPKRLPSAHPDLSRQDRLARERNRCVARRHVVARGVSVMTGKPTAEAPSEGSTPVNEAAPLLSHAVSLARKSRSLGWCRRRA